MGLKQWQTGRIVALWIATPFTMAALFLVTAMLSDALGLTTLAEISTPYLLLWTLMAFWPFFAMLFVTWKWLKLQR